MLDKIGIMGRTQGVNESKSPAIKNPNKIRPMCCDCNKNCIVSTSELELIAFKFLV